MRFRRSAPWIHAAVIGLVAGGAIVAEHGHAGTAQLAIAAAIVGIARAIGWLLGGEWRHHRGRRRIAPEATVGEDVQQLREDVKRLCNIAHGVNNNLSVLLGELDLLVMRISTERSRTDASL